MAFIEATYAKRVESDDELVSINGGPGPGHENFQYGDIVTNVEKFHKHLKNYLSTVKKDIDKNIQPGSSRGFDAKLPSASFVNYKGFLPK